MNRRTVRPTDTLTVPTFPCSRFTWIADAKSLAAEVSDLGHNPFRRLYADAADEGLAITSGRTGRVARFYVESTNRDADNDVIGWTLRPTPETLRLVPESAGIKVVVFND